MAEITIKTEGTFNDLDLNFNVHPTTKDVTQFKNERSIVNSIKNLILTNHYERPFQPELGSNLRRMLFEQVDNLTGAQLEREITEVIGNFEPRATVKDVTAVPTPDENGYSVNLVFYMDNNAAPISIDFFLERVR